MPSNDDLLSLWLNRRLDKSSSESDDLPVKKGLSENLPKTNPDVGQNGEKTDSPETPANRRPSPALSGQLADYLSKQDPRSIEPVRVEKKDASWTISDANTRASVAMALVLTSHIARFAGTGLDERLLNNARDTLVHTFGARDAVKIEVEAYELLQWFARSMNHDWKESVESEVAMRGETSESAIIRIIQNAIDEKYDLQMRYYTGSRGEFSERRITPLGMTAEKYLVAFCHLRNEERVFRLTRIVQLTPIVDDADKASLLCYPNPADTKLPPLPERPVVSKEPAKKQNRRGDQNKNKSDSSAKKSSSAKGSSKTASIARDGAKKQTQSGQPVQKTFDAFWGSSEQKNASKTKSAGSKHAKSKQENRCLPGFDDKSH